MNKAFALGVSISVLSITLLAFWGRTDSFIQSLPTMFIIIVVSVGAFSAGRGDNVFSMSPVINIYRSALAFFFGCICGALSLPMLMAVSSLFSDKLRIFFSGMSLLPIPLLQGRLIGPTFSKLSKRWPSIKKGGRLE